MNGQPVSMLAFQLKKLLAKGATAEELAAAANELMARERQTHLEQHNNCQVREIPVVFGQPQAM